MLVIANTLVMFSCYLIMIGLFYRLKKKPFTVVKTEPASDLAVVRSSDSEKYYRESSIRGAFRTFRKRKYRGRTGSADISRCLDEVAEDDEAVALLVLHYPGVDISGAVAKPASVQADSHSDNRPYNTGKADKADNVVFLWPEH